MKSWRTLFTRDWNTEGTFERPKGITRYSKWQRWGWLSSSSWWRYSSTHPLPLLLPDGKYSACPVYWRWLLPVITQKEMWTNAMFSTQGLMVLPFFSMIINCQWRTAFVHNSSTLAPSVNDVNTHFPTMSLNLRLSWCGSLLTQLAEWQSPRLIENTAVPHLCGS